MRQSGLQSQHVLNLQVGPKDSTWENVFLDLFLEAVSYMGDSGRVINFLAGSADSLHNCEEKTEAVSILHTEDRRDMDHSELCSVKV